MLCLELDPPLGERPGTLARRRFFISFPLPPLSLFLSLSSSSLACTLFSVRPRSSSPFLYTGSRPLSRFLATSLSNHRKRVHDFRPSVSAAPQHQTPQGVYAPGHKWNAATPACRPVLRGFSIPTGTSAMWLRAVAFLCHLSLFLLPLPPRPACPCSLFLR